MKKLLFWCILVLYTPEAFGLVPVPHPRTNAVVVLFLFSFFFMFSSSTAKACALPAALFCRATKCLRQGGRTRSHEDLSYDHTKFVTNSGGVCSNFLLLLLWIGLDRT